MLTGGGRVTILLAVTLGALGLLSGAAGVAVFGLALLIWLALQWAGLQWRCWREWSDLRIVRTIQNSSALEGVLWTDRRTEIVVSIEANRSPLSPRVHLEDLIPASWRVTEGVTAIELYSPHKSLELRYTVRPESVGPVELPGVALTLSDSCGLFRCRRFIECLQTRRVFPSFIDLDDARPTRKGLNALPPPGIHRLQRAGLGAELLELREYVPGDAPKTIAWKASARRDRLMTRQYETEVPVRTLLIFDGDKSWRLGAPGRRLVDQCAFVAASIARSSLAARDPVGLITLDGSIESRLAPGQGERHFRQLLASLQNYAAPRASEGPVTGEFVDRVYSASLRRWPELLDPALNRSPFLFWPFRPRSRRRRADRWRLAALFAELDGVSPDRQAAWFWDDELWSARVRLQADRMSVSSNSDRQDRAPPRLIDPPGGAPLVRAISRTIARARDNELYVIFSDLLAVETDLTATLRAIRLARARRHRVVVIIPSLDARPHQQPPEFRSTDTSPSGLRQAAERWRRHRQAQEVQRALAAEGAAVAFAADRQSIQLVLGEADLCRHSVLHRGKG